MSAAGSEPSGGAAVQELLDELASRGAIEVRALASASLFYAESERPCAPPVELVRSERGTLAYIALADAIELEFSDESTDQAQAVDILDLALDGGMAQMRSGMKRWISVGDVGKDAEGTAIRTWCPWRSSARRPGEFRSLRI